MTDVFDPYHKWLGIPPDEQPPDHYRLLGVVRFESDPDVIAAAADQRMAHLRSFQSGKHVAASQKLLNEVAEARVCLLSIPRRLRYDEQLGANLGTLRETSSPPPPPPPPPPSPPSPPPPPPREAPAPRGPVADDSGLDRFLQHVEDGPKPHPSAALFPMAYNKRAATPWGLVVAGACGALLLIVGLLFARLANDSFPPKPQSAKGKDLINVDPGDVPPDRAVLILRWPATEREGAELTIDGRRPTPADSSPGHLRFELEPGEHQVRIVRKGYAPFDERLWLPRGKKTDKAVFLEPVVQGDGTGLAAEYCNGRHCEELKLKRVDRKVSFLWGTNPPDELVPADDFSVRWSGYLKAPFAGRYKLCVECDDGLQLWLDKRLILLRSPGMEWHAEVEVELTGKPQSLKIEYWEERGDAAMCLNWIPPGRYVEHAVPHGALFYDEKVAEATRVDPSILRPAPSDSPLPAGQPVDLLQLIDPQKHAIKGRWWFDGNSLVSGRERAALIELPYPLPDEYEVRMVVERVDGNDALGLDMTAGGKPFTVVFDAHPDAGGLSGVELIEGTRVDRNETRRTGFVFQNGKTRRLHYSVHNSRLTVVADSETLIDWAADYRRCALYRDWIGDRVVPFSLGAWDSRFRISELTCRPLSTRR